MAVPRIVLAFVSSTVGKLLGFLRLQAIAASLGATATSDALLLSLTVTSVFDVVFVSGSAVLVLQSRYIRSLMLVSPRIAATRYVRSVLLWAVLAVSFGACMALLAKPIAALLAPGFDGNSRDVFQELCFVGACIPVATLAMVYASVLNRLHGGEVIYTLNPVLVNGASILALFVARFLSWSATTTAYALLVSILISTLAMTFFQAAFIPPQRRRLVWQMFVRSLHLARLKRALKVNIRELATVWPIAGAVLLQQGFTMISYAFASKGGEGLLTIIGLGERLSNVVLALIVMTFITVLEPSWARVLAVRKGSLSQIREDLLVLGVLVTSVAATLAVAGDSAARVLFAHGALGSQGIDELAIVARLFGLYLPGAAFALVFARLLVIVGRIRSLPTTNAALLLLHGGVCWLLVHFYGPRGIPLSVALVSSIQALAYGAFLREHLFDSTRYVELASLLVVAVVCFGCSYLSGQLALPDAARVGVVGVMSLLSGAAAAHLLGLPFARGLARLRAF